MSTGDQHRALSAIAVALSALAITALPAGAQPSEPAAKAIIQSVPPGVPIEGKTPPLNLSDDQRARIRAVLAGKHTDVSLAMKENQKAKDFEPRVDETIPKGLEAEAFPQPLISEIPATRQYTYLKFKGQVLIVNPMTHKIVDMFPETGG